VAGVTFGGRTGCVSALFGPILIMSGSDSDVSARRKSIRLSNRRDCEDGESEESITFFHREWVLLALIIWLVATARLPSEDAQSLFAETKEAFPVRSGVALVPRSSLTVRPAFRRY